MSFGSKLALSAGSIIQVILQFVIIVLQRSAKKIKSVNFYRRNRMSEERLKALEASNADVAVSERYKGPIGDLGLEFLDKEFSKLEEWVNIRLKDGIYKTLILGQMDILYAIMRTFLAKNIPI